MQSILKTLPALLEQTDEPEVRQAIASALWPSVVGDQLRAHSQPFRLNNSVLSIAVPNADWKREFEHNAAQIVYRLNAAAGQTIVRRILWVVDTVAFEQSTNGSLTTRAAVPQEVIDPHIVSSAGRIDNIELRNNFIAAAGNCLSRKAAT